MSPTPIRRVMRRIRQTVRLALLSSLAGPAALPAQQATPSVTAPRLASAAAPLAIRGVTVIDVRTGQHIPNQTVVIVGQRIQTITASPARLPRGARVVDGRGKYLIPGLWDMHVHPTRYVDIAYPLFIANGITGVRDAGSDVPLVTLNRWKQEITAGTRPGPHVLVSGQALDGPATTPASIPVHRTLATPSEARLAVDLLKSGGADMIKTYDLSRDMVLAIAAEARRIGMPFGGHSPNVSGLELSDSGVTFLDHNPWFAPGDCADSASKAAPDPCRSAYEHLRRNNTWISTIIDGHPSSPELDSLYVAQAYQRYARFWPASLPWGKSWPSRSIMLDSIRRLSLPLWDPGMEAALRQVTPRLDPEVQAGLPRVLGTDVAITAATPITVLYFMVGPGFTAHLRLAEFVLSGMTPTEALQTATLNPARALRATDSLGTVEAGKVADLVLLDADPLQAIWNTTKIRAVIANGRYYDRAALDRLLAAAQRAAARARPDTVTTSP